MKIRTENCGYRLRDVNFDKQVVTFMAHDNSSEVKFSFEYIQDVARYTTGEWDWNPTKESVLTFPINGEKE